MLVQLSDELFLNGGLAQISFSLVPLLNLVSPQAKSISLSHQQGPINELYLNGRTAQISFLLMSYANTVVSHSWATLALARMIFGTLYEFASGFQLLRST